MPARRAWCCRCCTRSPSPGDRIVLTSPTFDGYPIFAQMARLESVTVPLDAHGHHDLDALADAASDARVVVLCRPHNPTGTLESAADVERFLQRVPSDTIVLLDEAYIEFVAPEHRLDAPALVRAVPECRGAADVLEGIRAGRLADRLRVRRARAGQDAVDDAAAVRDRHHQRGRGGRLLRCGSPTAAAYSVHRRGTSIPAAAAAVDGYLQHRLRTRTSCICPPPAEAWRQEFDAAGVRARHYADGGVRITIGGRASTRAVLAARGAHALNALRSDARSARLSAV